MEKKVSFVIEEDIYEKFCLALNLTKEDENNAIESCLKWYVVKTFEEVSQEYKEEAEKRKNLNCKGKFYAKAVKRIPVWAQRPEQYCHKIIRAFFWCQKQYGEVYLDKLEDVCSKEDKQEFYVPAFKNNYYQMKSDAVKTYGKVFEDDGKLVRIWDEINEVLLEYKDYFCN